MIKNISNLKLKLYDDKSTYNKYILPFFILLLFILLNTVIIFNLYNKDKQKEDILRLHVVANSNDIYDQIIKLKVENEINKYIEDNYTNLKDNKQELLQSFAINADEITSICNNVLDENNINYDTKIKIGKINYEKKISQTLDMDAGCYNSMQIILGDGNGKNIWSLIFPDENTIKNISNLDTILPGINNLFKGTSYEYNLNITGKDVLSNTNSKDYDYEFKILDIINNIIKK